MKRYILNTIALCICVAIRHSIGQDLTNVVGDSPSVCSPCAEGFAVKEQCSSSTDTICTGCPLGTFNDYASIDAICTPCTSCNDGYFQWTPCMSTQDTQCRACVNTDGLDIQGHDEYRRKCESTGLDESDSSGEDLFRISPTSTNSDFEDDSSGESSGAIDLIFSDADGTYTSTIIPIDFTTKVEVDFAGETTEAKEVLEIEYPESTTLDIGSENKIETSTSALLESTSAPSVDLPNIDKDDIEQTTQLFVKYTTARQPIVKDTTTSKPFVNDITTSKQHIESIETTSEEAPIVDLDVDTKSITTESAEVDETTTSDSGILWGGVLPVTKKRDDIAKMAPPEVDQAVTTAAADGDITTSAAAIIPAETTSAGGFRWPVLVCVMIVVVLILVILLGIICGRRKQRQQKHSFPQEKAVKHDDPGVKSAMIDMKDEPILKEHRTPIYTGKRQGPEAPKYSLLNNSGKNSPKPALLTPGKKHRAFGLSKEFDFMDDASDDELDKRPPSSFNKDHKPANTASLRNIFNRYVSQSDVAKEGEEEEHHRLNGSIKEAEPLTNGHVDGNAKPVSNGHSGSYSRLNQSDPVYVVNA